MSRLKKVVLDEIPIMITPEKELVCIERGNETFAMAISGASGTGKSLLLHRLLEDIYFQWEDNVCFLNDVSEETYDWSSPMKCIEFNTFNKTLHQFPCQLPMVYVYPNTNSLKLDLKKYVNYPTLLIAIVFTEILDNLRNYISAVNPDFELKQSGMYIKQMKEELEVCETPEDVREVVKNSIPDEKAFQSMKYKILGAFETLFDEKILDITNPECKVPIYPMKTGFEESGIEYSGNPICTLMKNGYVPSLVTSDLSTKKYYSDVLTYYVNSIFETHEKEFIGERTFMFFDELAEICKSNRDAITKSLGLVAARGRIKRVGLIYATQYYDRIPHLVKGAKLNYFFSFKQHSDDIRQEIKRDFNLERATKNRLKDLKKYQCIAMTNNKFILYRDGERWEETEPIEGTIFFPLSNHKAA